MTPFCERIHLSATLAACELKGQLEADAIEEAKAEVVRDFGLGCERIHD